MRPAEKIKKLFVNSNVTVTTEFDDKVKSDTFHAFEKIKKTKSAQHKLNTGRNILQSPFTKLAAAAVIILLFSLFTVNILIKRSHTKTNSSAQHILGDNQHKVMEFDTSPRYILFNAQNDLKETNPCNILPVLPKQL
jgi:hypothetical protein